jgi:hypothetical protein
MASNASDGNMRRMNAGLLSKAETFFRHAFGCSAVRQSFLIVMDYSSRVLRVIFSACWISLFIFASYIDAIKARMSSTRHMVQRPSFTGVGKRPDFTPSHQQDFLTGMIGGVGGFALGSPMICGSRRKPVSGSCVIEECSCPSEASVGRHSQFNRQVFS